MRHFKPISVNRIFRLFIILIFFGCQNQKSNLNENDVIIFGPEIQDENHHQGIHQEMELASIEGNKMDSVLISLYKLSDIEPKLAIKKADSIIYISKNETNKIKLMNQNHILNSFGYFIAEIYYKIGDYNNSLKNIKHDKFILGDDAAAIAANYIKLGKPEKAKPLIDSIRNYLTDFARANYFESVGDKKNAFEIYRKIKNDKEIKHYAYYKLAASRLDELSKGNPKLLNEIYFPTGNPNFEIADSDDENRTKIFNLFENLSEVIKCGCEVYIYESPIQNDKDYYWIKIGNIESNDLRDIANFNKLNTTYDFFVYPKNNFEIKFYNPKTTQRLSLEEWRRKK